MMNIMEKIEDIVTDLAMEYRMVNYIVLGRRAVNELASNFAYRQCPESIYTSVGPVRILIADNFEGIKAMESHPILDILTNLEVVK